MANCSKQEYHDMSELGGLTEASNVSSEITELSPIKVSHKNSQVKYFSGKVTDGKMTVRVVSIDPGLRNQMEKSKVEGSTVSVINCQIKQATHVGSSAREILHLSSLLLKFGRPNNFSSSHSDGMADEVIESRSSFMAASLIP